MTHDSKPAVARGAGVTNPRQVIQRGSASPGRGFRRRTEVRLDAIALLVESTLLLRTDDRVRRQSVNHLVEYSWIRP